MIGTASDLMSRILPDLYATLEDEGRWSVVLDAVCSELQLSSAAVQVMADDAANFNEHWCFRDSRSFREASRHDRLVNNGANPRLGLKARRFSPHGGALLSDLDSFPHNSSELADFRTRLDKCGMGPAMWLVIPMTEGRHITCILHSRNEDTNGLTREAEFLAALEPHLDRLVRLSEQSARFNRPVLEQVLEHVRIGVVVVDSTLAVSWRNSAAARILDRSAHLALRSDRLCAGRRRDQQRMEQLIHDPENYHGGLLVVGQDDENPVEVRAVRMSPRPGNGWDSGPGMTALFLAEPDNALMLDEAEISALSGLSPAESRLVAALVSGSGLDHFASGRGISLGTARVQLKQALAKTATHRQSSLVGRMMRSVVSQTRPETNAHFGERDTLNGRCAAARLPI
ncbi:MAG: hypothetical protein ABI395_03335 [Sphingobium sp.]